MNPLSLKAVSKYVREMSDKLPDGIILFSDYLCDRTFIKTSYGKGRREKGRRST